MAKAEKVERLYALEMSKVKKKPHQSMSERTKYTLRTMLLMKKKKINIYAI